MDPKSIVHTRQEHREGGEEQAANLQGTHVLFVCAAQVFEDDPEAPWHFHIHGTSTMLGLPTQKLYQVDGDDRKAGLPSFWVL